jgi:hypothetical protein
MVQEIHTSVGRKEMVFDNLDYHRRSRVRVVLESLQHLKAAVEQVVDNYEINRSINSERRRAPSQDKMLTSAYFWDRSHHNPPAH